MTVDHNEAVRIAQVAQQATLRLRRARDGGSVTEPCLDVSREAIIVTIRSLLRAYARLHPHRAPMVPLSHPALAHLPRWRICRDAMLMGGVRITTIGGAGHVIIQDSIAVTDDLADVRLPAEFEVSDG
jgi:hypothetical protein